MTDEYELEFITFANIITDNAYWETIPIMNGLIQKNKDPMVVHIDCKIDTLSSALTEIAAPTTAMLWFDDAQSLSVVSTSTTDAAVEISIFGQKSDDTVGGFTYDVTGTTTLAVDDWKNVWTARITDTGTVDGTITLIQDSTTTLLTFTNTTKDPKIGKFYVPNGYRGGLIAGTAFLIDTPSNAAAGNNLMIGESFGCHLTLDNGKEDVMSYSHMQSGQTHIPFKGKYKTAVTTAELHSYIGLWAV